MKLYPIKLTQLELVIVENLILKETQTNDEISKSDRNILTDVAIRMNRTRHGEID
jgi:hypothetical protein